jgi:hypothetical protein
MTRREAIRNLKNIIVKAFLSEMLVKNGAQSTMEELKSHGEILSYSSIATLLFPSQWERHLCQLSVEGKVSGRAPRASLL